MHTPRRLMVTIGLLLAMAASAQAAQILFTLAPELETQRFGAQVAPLGDVNGDGFADILVLAPDAAGLGYRGTACVYFGGPWADAVADVVLKGLPGVGLEQTLAGPFDYNADGHDDIAIGAPGYDDGDHTDAGAVFIYYGGPAVDPVADLTLVGEWTERRFGSAIACSGRFNPDDAYDDLAVTIDPGGYGFGPYPTVYVCFGGPQPATTDGWRRIYADYYAGWGHHLASVGDFNGDGFGDILATAPWAEEDCSGPVKLDCTCRGSVLLYRGGAVMRSMETTLRGDPPNARLGADADGAFDVDGDGFDDLIAAAPGLQRACLYFGQAAEAPVAVARRLDLSPGFDVAGLGDVNGDGFADVAVADSTNLVVVFYGGAAMDTIPDVTLTPEPGEQWDAVQVTRAGDFDGDGLADLAVHFRQDTSPTTRRDRVRLYGHLTKTQVAVYLASFQAARRDDRVVVSWTVTGLTAGETFHVWRGSSPASRERLTAVPLPGRESCEFIDRAPGAGPADYWLEVLSAGADDAWYGPAHVAAAPLPERLSLAPASPNPFNPRTTIRFALPAHSQVRLAIFDQQGRRVRTLVEAAMAAGEHAIEWDGRDDLGRSLVSGGYFVRLTAEQGSCVSKVMLIR